MRAFVGIEFSTELKNEIHEVQEKLKPFAQNGRWKHTDNFHLTLCFLGEIDEQQVSEINGILADIAPKHQPFTLGIEKLGTFGQGTFNPDIGLMPIRVLWLGIEGGEKALRALQSDIEEKLETLGFPPDPRGYNPHVTLAQSLKIKCDIDKLERQSDLFAGKIEVDSIHLFISEVSDGNRIYRPISNHKLKKRENAS